MKKIWEKIKEYILVRPNIFIALGLIFMVTIIVLYWPLIGSRLGFYLPASIEGEVSEGVVSAPKTGKLVNKKGVLYISKINVKAPIVFMEWPDDAPDEEIQNKIQEYLKGGVGHYPNTALPGEIGNVFITGHSSNYPWAGGNYNYVFASLDKLKDGDQIIIYFNNRKFIYEVYDKIVVSPNERSVLAQTNTSILSLMTCTPAGTDISRLVVKARQIEPNPKDNIDSYEN